MLPADGGMSICSPGCKASKMPPHYNEDVALFITVNLDRFTQQFWFHVPLSTVSQQGQDQNFFSLLHLCLTIVFSPEKHCRSGSLLVVCAVGHHCSCFPIHLVFVLLADSLKQL